LLIVSPHSDDAALSLGYFLDSNVSTVELRHVTVFSQSAFGILPTHARTMTEARQLEDSTYFSTLGRIHQPIPHENLGYDDAHLRLNLGADTSRLFSDAVDELLQARILDQITDIAANSDLILLPAGIGRHIDHVLLSLVGQSLRSGGLRVAFYMDQPYALLSLHPVPSEALWTAENTPAVKAAKIAAASIYRSQPAATRLAAALESLPQGTPVEAILMDPT
jgi:hypothetical protein